jgi:hypothetical protein
MIRFGIATVVLLIAIVAIVVRTFSLYGGEPAFAAAVGSVGGAIIFRALARAPTPDSPRPLEDNKGVERNARIGCVLLLAAALILGHWYLAGMVE